ncbi:hypothetical protein OQA88_10738 [Cercophora sp. LCS_1]
MRLSLLAPLAVLATTASAIQESIIMLSSQCDVLGNNCAYHTSVGLLNVAAHHPNPSGYWTHLNNNNPNGGCPGTGGAPGVSQVCIDYPQRRAHMIYSNGVKKCFRSAYAVRANQCPQGYCFVTNWELAACNW